MVPPAAEDHDAAGIELVQREILAFYPELVRELGGDPDALLGEAGLEPAAFHDGLVGATYRQHVFLLERAAETLACPDFGMRLGIRQQGWRSYGLLGPAMRSSVTFLDAVRFAATHIYAHSLAARIWIRRLPMEGGVLCCHDILLDGIVNPVQAIEQVLLVGNLGTRELTGGRARARRVHFRHQPVAPERAYRRHFGCDVLFGQEENGLFLSEQDIASPIVDPDAVAYGLAARQVAAGLPGHRAPLSTRVRGIVLQHLGGPRCTNAQVAADLGLHMRTLHRQLAAEGSSFQKVKDAVRRDRMLYYVRHTTLDFSRVSEQLGFAEQAILTRRCRQWFGCSPSQLRHAKDLAEAVAPAASAGRGT